MSLLGRISSIWSTLSAPVVKWLHDWAIRSYRLQSDYLETKKKRTRLLILFIVSLLVLMIGVELLIQRPQVPLPISNNIAVLILVNINIILLGFLVLLVFRNLIKLYFERKDKILGHKFQTKLVLAFVTMTLIPSVSLFLVATGLLTNSVDNWFNIRVEQSLQRALEVSESLYQKSEEEVQGFGNNIGALVSEKRMMDPGNRVYLKNTVAKKLKDFEVDFIQVYDPKFNLIAEAGQAKLPIQFNTEQADSFLQAFQDGKSVNSVRKEKETNQVMSIVPVFDPSNTRLLIGSILVAKTISRGLVHRVQSITKGFEDYKQMKLLKTPIKTSYEITLLIIMLVILFSAIWFGFYLARGITIPIQKLAGATREVSQGNLDVQLDIVAKDEIGMLVDSFKQMTIDLKKGKQDIERANEDLKRTNAEVDRRRQYIETVIQKVASGVISVDKMGKISTINRSAIRILDLDPEVNPLAHQSYRKVFQSTHLESIRALIKQMLRLKTQKIEKELQLQVSGKTITLRVNVSVLRDPAGAYLGILVVFDDLTELIRAQKSNAWREVARILAHEIKNPLTPIQLNTQRLQKKFLENPSDFGRIFTESTNIIIQEVDGLKNLLNEFSKFARLPESNPKSSDFHRIILDVVRLYEELRTGVTIRTELDPRIQEVNVDPEQMKRVFINLFDNSMDAVQNNGEIVVRTHYNRDDHRIVAEVRDNGCGVPNKDKNMVFLPHFSTKKKGTGLGLAIVHRIISDHNGRIEVRDNSPRGTTMAIELPFA